MSEAQKRVAPAELKKFCIEGMLKCGMPEADAQITAEVLVTTDQWGVHSHGTVSLPQYLKRVCAGGLSADAESEVVAEGPAWAVLDGKNVIGMVSSYRAAKLAISKAKSAGVGFVTIRNGIF